MIEYFYCFYINVPECSLVWENSHALRENRLLDSGFIIEKLSFYSLSLKWKQKLFPNFQQASSGECAWADVTESCSSYLCIAIERLYILHWCNIAPNIRIITWKILNLEIKLMKKTNFFFFICHQRDRLSDLLYSRNAVLAILNKVICCFVTLPCW